MTDIIHLIKESIGYAIPAFVLAGIITIYYAYRTFKLSREFQDYKSDKLRHDLEAKISDLSKQLAINEERFKSINHLLLASQSAGRGLRAIGPGFRSKDFFEDLGVNLDVWQETDLIFVLIPFNNMFLETYNTIKAVCEEAGFRCLRGDEKMISGEILPHIIQQVVKARLIIADITGRNANVFYELGIAHALGKQVLLLSKSSEDIPFDISRIRVLIYKRFQDLSKNLRNWLIHTFADIKNS